MAAFIVTPYVTTNERKLWLALLKVSALHLDVYTCTCILCISNSIPLRVYRCSDWHIVFHLIQIVLRKADKYVRGL